ncbi:MAG: HRDC domain-containing protein [Candidatus Methanomethylophilaceae archaeon]|nr:HRDC domain-containing protein [Candidatus Methanomethylophilaceae archaeon]
MAEEEQLLAELTSLRDSLRAGNPMANGRLPQICSDEALVEMAQRVPHKAEDLAAIAGIGQRFVEQYGEAFLDITRRYALEAVKGSEIDPRAAEALRELEKKLINVSRSNRLLFQPRASRRNAFDLGGYPEGDVIGLLFGRRRSLLLCDSADGPDSVRTYRQLNDLFREVSRDIRDRGRYDLYVAYPFVQGRMGGEGFEVRAPLALFPVTLEREAGTMTLASDPSRDAMFNNTLILARIKSTGEDRPLPHNLLESTDFQGFRDELVRFYGDNGIPLTFADGLVPFESYRPETFPDYQPGEMELVCSAVLGRYSIYSSSVQRDFDLMLAKGEINGILSDLILGDGRQPPVSGVKVSERDLAYVNRLNSAQEEVLSSIRNGNELVVQGPPGTGKSQVITGLIANAVLGGQTVLMVSEKKTALDVVYSRLGDLSRYCLLIDDVSNKDLFYRQLSTMMSTDAPSDEVGEDTFSDGIDEDVERLERIADVMYSPGPFGIEPYKLYTRDRADMGDMREVERYRMLKEEVDGRLLQLDYPGISELHRRFGSGSSARNLKEYRDISQSYPWMTQMRSDMSDYEIGQMKADLLDLEQQMIDVRSMGFVSRLFSKGKVSREATLMLDNYFVNYNEHTMRLILDDPRAVFDGLDDYETFTARASAYRRMGRDERSYGEDVMSLSEKTGMSLPESNDSVYDWILDDHLLRFDADHRDVLQEMHDFDGIISDMDHRMEGKRGYTRSMMGKVLREGLGYISGSKRRSDIMRIIESKRKWHLGKFINRYGYELFKGVKVWLLTPEVVSEIIPMDMGIFDLLIFDEASQMYVEKGIPSIYRAKKVVVAGDHRQLRPSSLGTGRVAVQDDDDEDPIEGTEEDSLLDLARSRFPSVLLNFHYRSRYEELIAFSNRAFYGGRLYVSPNVSTPEEPPIKVYRVDGRWENKSNRVEAEKIVGLIREFLATRKERETVGIITFNSAQRDLINDVLDEECARDPGFGAAIAEEYGRHDNGEDVGLFIKNIESVQGDERDVIMFSVGYARNSEGKLMQRFGWLNNQGGENRLNVAISRAKQKVIVVRSFEPEELQVDDSKNEGPRILRSYLQYADAVSDGDRERAEEILSSFGKGPASTGADGDPVAAKVRDELVSRGYEVDSDVGIGGYRMDLAVRKGDRYVLGIECDGHLYSGSSSARERDYHRQRYLESRGWRIYRLWTPNLWRDREGEISHIVSEIEGSPRPM